MQSKSIYSKHSFFRCGTEGGANSTGGECKSTLPTSVKSLLKTLYVADFSYLCMRNCEIEIAYGALYCNWKPEQYDGHRRESGTTRALHRPVR